MAKIYSPASEDVLERLARMREKYHPQLDVVGVTVDALFVFGDGDNPGPVHTHGGYPAAASIKILGPKHRAAGRADVELVVDRANYGELEAAQRDALLDHELTHLEVVEGGFTLDKDTGELRLVAKLDGQKRPKLKIRKHDRQLGWFDEVAERHGADSPECRQADVLMSSAGQLYFDFDRTLEVVRATAAEAADLQASEAAESQVH